MNYLAHAYLSPDDPEILMGNLWGDLIRPSDYEDLSQNVLDGILLHKRIDAFTDQHHHVEEFIKLVRPFQHKYTPVVVDVLMDFILSKYWHDYHNASLDTFCERVYNTVNKSMELIPERLHPRINRMMENKWLESCKSREHMVHTLRMLSHRASFENNMAAAMIPYEMHEEKMDALFKTFFRDLSQTIILRNEG